MQIARNYYRDVAVNTEIWEGCTSTYIPASPDIENDNASIDRIIYLHTENTTSAIYNVLHDIAHYIKFLLTQVWSK